MRPSSTSSNNDNTSSPQPESPLRSPQALQRWIDDELCRFLHTFTGLPSSRHQEQSFYKAGLPNGQEQKKSSCDGYDRSRGADCPWKEEERRSREDSQMMMDSLKERFQDVHDEYLASTEAAARQGFDSLDDWYALVCKSERYSPVVLQAESSQKPWWDALNDLYLHYQAEQDECLKTWEEVDRVVAKLARQGTGETNPTWPLGVDDESFVEQYEKQIGRRQKVAEEEDEDFEGDERAVRPQHEQWASSEFMHEVLRAIHQDPATSTSSPKSTAHSSSPSPPRRAKNTPSLISSLTTTERVVDMDGTVRTKTVLKKRFADGTEESNETVQVDNQNHGQVANPFRIAESKKGASDIIKVSRPPKTEEGKKNGWFWTNW